MKRQMSCVVFVAHTFISVTAGGRGSPPLRGDFASSTEANICQYRNSQICLVRVDMTFGPYDNLSDYHGRVRHLTFTGVRYANTKALLDTKANSHTYISDKREALLPIEDNSSTF